jgi:hypothetical protein
MASATAAAALATIDVQISRSSAVIQPNRSAIAEAAISSTELPMRSVIGSRPRLPLAAEEVAHAASLRLRLYRLRVLLPFPTLPLLLALLALRLRLAGGRRWSGHRAMGSRRRRTRLRANRGSLALGEQLQRLELLIEKRSQPLL